ncbi:MAG: M20/M25/M40 family metallo-hydrolase, partial [bacterium]|nr:M20/M25/M40 family metallo-hydrolase [bacterium]
ARLARAITRLEENPFPAALPEPTRQMLSGLGRHAPFAARLLYANVDPLEPLVARVLAALGPETAAMARTTVAVTQLEGSPAANVLATRASAVINVRVAVGSSIREAEERIRRTIADESVDVRVLGGTEPSRVSPAEGEQWELLAALVDEVFPDAVATPYVQNGGTDARQFSPWVDHVYRFAPLRMSGEERARLHAADESIAAETLREGVRFMARLIEEACG